jgi:hypothetical protein
MVATLKFTTPVKIFANKNMGSPLKLIALKIMFGTGLVSKESVNKESNNNRFNNAVTAM